MEGSVDLDGELGTMEGSVELTAHGEKEPDEASNTEDSKEDHLALYQKLTTLLDQVEVKAKQTANETLLEGVTLAKTKLKSDFYVDCYHNWDISHITYLQETLTLFGNIFSGNSENSDHVLDDTTEESSEIPPSVTSTVSPSDILPSVTSPRETPPLSSTDLSTSLTTSVSQTPVVNPSPNGTSVKVAPRRALTRAQRPSMTPPSAVVNPVSTTTEKPQLPPHNPVRGHVRSRSTGGFGVIDGAPVPTTAVSNTNEVSEESHNEQPTLNVPFVLIRARTPSGSTPTPPRTRPTGESSRARGLTANMRTLSGTVVTVGSRAAGGNTISGVEGTVSDTVDAAVALSPGRTNGPTGKVISAKVRTPAEISISPTLTVESNVTPTMSITHQESLPVQSTTQRLSSSFPTTSQESGTEPDTSTDTSLISPKLVDRPSEVESSSTPIVDVSVDINDTVEPIPVHTGEPSAGNRDISSSEHSGTEQLDHHPSEPIDMTSPTTVRLSKGDRPSSKLLDSSERTDISGSSGPSDVVPDSALSDGLSPNTLLPSGTTPRAARIGTSRPGNNSEISPTVSGTGVTPRTIPTTARGSMVVSSSGSSGSLSTSTSTGANNNNTPWISGNSVEKIKTFEEIEEEGPSCESDSEPNEDFTLTPQQEREIKEAFTIFDITGKGCVTRSDIMDILTNVGREYSKEEIDAFMSEIDKDCTDKILYKDFRSMMIKQMKPGDQPVEVRKYFQIFDPGKTGYIEAEELLLVLTGMGDQITPEEVQEIIGQANMENGKIDFEQFIKLVCS